jgi:hypothetical protein
MKIKAIFIALSCLLVFSVIPAHSQENKNRIDSLDYSYTPLDARTSVWDSYNPNKKVLPNIKYYISSKINQDVVNHVKHSVNVIHNIFSEYNPPKYSELLLWTELDKEWSNEHHRIITRNQVAEWRQRLFNCNSAYADKIQEIQIIVICTTQNALKELGRREVTAHEYFHLVQGSNNMFVPETPCWIVEGMASFYGATIGGSLKETQEFYSVHAYSKVHPFENKTVSQLVPGKTVDMFKLLEDRHCGFFDNKEPYVGSAYILGAFAFEAIAAAYGQESISKFITSFNSSSNWKNNFYKTFDIKVESFYNSLAPYIEWRMKSLSNYNLVKTSRNTEVSVQEKAKEPAPVIKNDKSDEIKSTSEPVNNTNKTKVVINKNKKIKCVKNNKKLTTFNKKCPKGWVKI